MTDEPALRLEAFDARGIHFGHALWVPGGKWTVRVGRSRYETDSEDEAAQLLTRLGAATIRTDSGKK